MRALTRSIALLALCILPSVSGCTGSAASVASAARGHRLQVETTARGVRLTLIVPHSIYAKNALVQVALLVQNVSHRVVTVDGACPDSGPRVEAEVTSRSGYPEYPVLEHLPGIIGGGCVPRGSRRIAPGHTITVHRYVVLTHPGVRGTALLLTGVIQIQTKPTLVSLVPGSSPGLTIRTTGKVSAVVERPPGVRGPLVFRGWSSCMEYGARYSEIDPGWTQSNNGIAVPEIHSPDCHRIIEWHAVAGYLNQPIAVINYPRS